jgi:hypothetical protein
MQQMASGTLLREAERRWLQTRRWQWTLCQVEEETVVVDVEKRTHWRGEEGILCTYFVVNDIIEGPAVDHCKMRKSGFLSVYTLQPNIVFERADYNSMSQLSLFLYRAHKPPHRSHPCPYSIYAPTYMPDKSRANVKIITDGSSLDPHPLRGFSVHLLPLSLLICVMFCFE